jgi:DNA-binding CsgD family transcriptional regulator
MSKHAAQSQPTAARPPRKPGRPLYVATDKDRTMVKVMAAGGIEQAAIAAVLKISPKTLRKHFRHEIETAAAEIGAKVVASLINMAVGQSAAPGRAALPPNFNAAKWWTQARMGWSERIVVDDGKPADTPMRIVIEFVGEAAAPRTEQSAPRSGSRLSDDMRKNVQLVG